MPEVEKRPLRIFLCYSHPDRTTVRELTRRLSAESWIDPWLDELHLYPGVSWEDAIEQGVMEADVMIVCISQNSVTKEGYVPSEMRTPLDLANSRLPDTLYVIPLRLEESTIPRQLENWQFADYFPEKDRGRAYEQLLVSLRNRAKALRIIA
jgi:hypothetical protein